MAGKDADHSHSAEDHEHAHDPFDPGHLIGHVKDAEYFEMPAMFALDGKLKIPQPLNPDGHPIVEIETPIEGLIEPIDLRITKFMILEVIGAIILLAIFVPLANKIRTGGRPIGRLWNAMEAMLLFVRDEVARPAIGKHDADKFLPFLWTMFFFVLICNLLGMVPWAGSPTGAFAVTGALAFITFICVVGAGMAKMGPIGFWIGQVPHMDLPFILAIFLKPMIFAIEVLGLGIKHLVLGVRLLANMMAGHLVLAVLIALYRCGLAHSWESCYYGLLHRLPVLGATALSMLELFVAFLQAYIFAFLSSLFIGMAVHPH